MLSCVQLFKTFFTKYIQMKTNPKILGFQLLLGFVSVFIGLLLSGFVAIIFIDLPFLMDWIIAAIVVRIIIFAYLNSKKIKRVANKI